MRLLRSLTIAMLFAGIQPYTFVAGRSPVQGAANPPDSSAAAVRAALPKDVDPESFSRMPLPKREELNDVEKKIYDDLDAVDKEGRTGLRGPGRIQLNYPGLAEHSNRSFLRKTPLGGAEFQLANLVTAREMKSQVLWTAHEPEALRAGVSKEAVNAIKFRKPTTNLGEKEATIIDFGRELFQKDIVSSDTYARAKGVFGEKGVILLTAFIAEQTGTCLYARAFDQHLTPSKKPLLPIP